MSKHRVDRELRAWRDGELPLRRRLLLHLHLARCGGCRREFAAIDEERRLLTALLVPREPAPDLGEAWTRLQVLSGGLRSRGAGARAAGTILLATIAVLALLARPTSWASELEWLLHPTPVKAKASTTHDARFVERLLRLEVDGKVRILEDACCEDRDGEGPADDGLAIIKVTGRRATLSVLYEDLDGSRALTAGDLIRLVSRIAAPASTASAAY